MDFLRFCQWLEKSPIAETMRARLWIFPLAESIHLCGLTLLVGTVTIVCLQFFGLGLRRPKTFDLARSLAPWTRLGLGTMLITGPLMFASDPVRYYFNAAFHLKMLLLAVALIYHFTLYRKLASQKPPAWGKAVAGGALLVWVAVMLGGRAIEFF